MDSKTQVHNSSDRNTRGERKRRQIGRQILISNQDAIVAERDPSKRKVLEQKMVDIFNDRFGGKINLLKNSFEKAPEKTELSRVLNSLVDILHRTNINDAKKYLRLGLDFAGTEHASQCFNKVVALLPEYGDFITTLANDDELARLFHELRGQLGVSDNQVKLSTNRLLMSPISNNQLMVSNNQVLSSPISDNQVMISNNNLSLQVLTSPANVQQNSQELLAAIQPPLQTSGPLPSDDMSRGDRNLPAKTIPRPLLSPSKESTAPRPLPPSTTPQKAKRHSKPPPPSVPRRSKPLVVRRPPPPSTPPPTDVVRRSKPPPPRTPPPKDRIGTGPKPISPGLPKPPSKRKRALDSPELSKPSSKRPSICFDASMNNSKEWTGGTPPYHKTGQIRNNDEPVSKGTYIQVLQERNQAREQVQVLEDKINRMKYRLELRGETKDLSRQDLMRKYENSKIQLRQLQKEKDAKDYASKSKYKAMKLENRRLLEKNLCLEKKIKTLKSVVGRLCKQISGYKELFGSLDEEEKEKASIV